ncbi:hypothetical protein BN6_10410 [Saccharothrix espanaensis DSM 44229]|uniref:Uncharacterized protein n=1 Tax=Saccharothrix espanaensis (strain ATCC 51144 / DSM 44229 / JCM 9112 / NBRC 15066 / NRRL 15764) TaxID=1179773 RepID=K0JU81_SACES|nr:hypothetical protein BN6_10410 [Saccharothrix espanaensis DSM 44229]
MYLRGLVTACTRQRNRQRCSRCGVGLRPPAYRSGQLGRDWSIVGHATTELLEMTYSAAAYKPLTTAFRAAAERAEWRWTSWWRRSKAPAVC